MDWKDTKIWQSLGGRQDPHADAVRSVLGVEVPKIETLLKKSGTAPTDFTLHDADHSYRVAEWMARLIPSDVLPTLSPFELGLLLLSAYLHDIGMTPPLGKVRRLEEYLERGVSDAVDADEKRRFDGWLDEYAGESVDPCRDARNTASEKSRLVLAHYCRARHAAWSADWIRKNPGSHQFDQYAAWLDDLCILCESHVWSFEQLKGDRLAPKRVGQPAVIVHLRYLAVVLRVADILDLDPERTPEVVFRHRDVSEGSEISWRKDHDVSVDLDGRRIIIDAHPRSAKFHRAIEVTAQAIEDELRIAARLDAETHFGRASWPTPLPHCWHIEPFVGKTIRPYEDRYKYIDGAFRPDTNKILQLISGDRLYSTPFAAVRELLQNAFDAVREQVARERLSASNPANAAEAERIAEGHRVTVVFNPEAGNLELTVEDDGAGMSEVIIRDHLLVSGLSRRTDIRELERKCRRNGFQLERTGQFGIGVLSYFLLADQITVTTRRSSQCPDCDGKTWKFVIRDVADFGELSHEGARSHGTVVQLRLRPSVVGDAKVWFAELREYLEDTLVRVPCGFSLRSTAPDSDVIHYSPGWVRQERHLTELGMEYLESELRREIKYWRQAPGPAAQRKNREREAADTEDMLKRMRDSLTWQTMPDVDLPGVGRCRIHLPVFNLGIGESNLFLNLTRKGDTAVVRPIPNIVGRDAFATGTDSEILLSWKGMNVGVKPVMETYRRLESGIVSGGPIQVVSRPTHQAIVEVDLATPEVAKLSLSREFVELVQGDESVFRPALREVRRAFLSFAKDHPKSPFSLLTQRLAHEELPAKERLFWLHKNRGSDDAEVTWQPIRMPATNVAIDEVANVPWQSLEWDGKVVHTYCGLDFSVPGGGWGCVWSDRVASDRLVVVVLAEDEMVCVPLWTGARMVAAGFEGGACEYPPTWKALAGCCGFGGSTWNRASTLYERTTPAAWAWARESDLWDRPARLKQHERELRDDPGKAAVVLCSLLRSRNVNLWNGLSEENPVLMSDLWKSVVTATETGIEHVYYLYQNLDNATGSRNTILYRFGAKADEIRDNNRIASILHKPDEEWLLHVIP